MQLGACRKAGSYFHEDREDIYVYYIYQINEY